MAVGPVLTPVVLLLQLETSALLQQKLQYEDQLHACRQEVCSLQQRLKESVERASRVRQHAERQVNVLTLCWHAIKQ
jgi:hypothetical protein